MFFLIDYLDVTLFEKEKKTSAWNKGVFLKIFTVFKTNT